MATPKRFGGDSNDAKSSQPLVETEEMPRERGFGKGETDRFNIRLDPQTAAYYRTKANEHGISISEFLRRLLAEGVIAKNVHAFEKSIADKVDELSQVNANVVQQKWPNEALLSLFTSEALLTAIVEARDIQALYGAQDRAKRRLQKLLDGKIRPPEENADART